MKIILSGDEVMVLIFKTRVLHYYIHDCFNLVFDLNLNLKAILSIYDQTF